MPQGRAGICDSLYGAYEDSEQFLVIQPARDLRPHVDYLGSGVIYVLLQGREVSVWRPFRTRIDPTSILASGHRRDLVEHELRGPRYDLDMKPGDALFIPPLFPHLVRNLSGSVFMGSTSSRGRSVAWRK